MNLIYIYSKGVPYISEVMSSRIIKFLTDFLMQVLDDQVFKHSIHLAAPHRHIVCHLHLCSSYSWCKKWGFTSQNANNMTHHRLREIECLEGCAFMKIRMFHTKSLLTSVCITFINICRYTLLQPIWHPYLFNLSRLVMSGSVMFP